MNLLKEVLRHQVYPAMGCTEPASVALCAAHAAKALGRPPSRVELFVDTGTYKNGLGVALPNAGGERGNLLAGAIGALLPRPELGMKLLEAADPRVLAQAKRLWTTLACLPGKKGLFIEARVRGGRHEAVARIEGGHTDLVHLSLDGKRLAGARARAKPAAYRAALRRASLRELLAAADGMDAEDLAYVARGVEMNLAASRAGEELKKVGYYLRDLQKRGYLQDDVFSASKILTASACDARMDGRPIPVMSSGESGNQGIVAILVPYSVGKAFGVEEDLVLRSIGLSHLMNAFVKLYTGGLAPICGCAIAAGVGAAAAIVYQQNGPDAAGVTLAVNNVISDLGGMLCDGAKSGCALKVVSSTDAAIRAGYMGIHHYGITEREGFVGRTAEETIRNLGRISTVGMGRVDRTIVGIMKGKQKR